MHEYDTVRFEILLRVLIEFLRERLHSARESLRRDVKVDGDLGFQETRVDDYLIVAQIPNHEAVLQRIHEHVIVLIDRFLETLKRLSC